MTARSRTMSIRAKTTTFVVIAIGLLTALTATIQFRTSLSRVEEIEDDQAIDQVNRVVRQLGNAQADIGGTNADWAWWDDSYAFVQDGNQEYQDTNLYAEAFTPLGIDLLAYVDADGNIVYEAWYTDEGVVAIPDAILGLVLPGGSLADFAEDPRATPGGIAEAGNDRFLVTSRAILPSTTMTDVVPAGVLLMGRRIDQTFVSELAELVGLDLVLEPCVGQTCSGLSSQARITKTSTAVTTDVTISGPSGEPALHGSVTEPRTMYNESLNGIKRVLAILVGAGALAVILTLAGLRRLIIGPLERLGSTVSAVARSNDPSHRAAVDRTDEIGELADAVNVMLARLENSQRQVLEAKAQVEGASAAKSRFLSRVSHELRTPINGVLAYAQLLQLDHPEGESGESIAQIITSARHITSLVDEFLDIARIEAGSIPINVEDVSPTMIAQEVVKMTQPLADAQGVDVEVIGSDTAVVLADPLRLRQSILNLVSNAIKYGRGTEPITVTIGPKDGSTTIEVRDHGPGIAADLLPRLFVPFDRLGADGSDQQGSGVGLSVTKQLIELMNGTVEVESEVGAGTAFILTLPSRPEPGSGDHGDSGEVLATASYR